MDKLENDIRKYLRGELTSAEKHALERRALQDPFLADALEGSASIDMHDLDADLRSLQSSLQQRIEQPEKGRVISLWSWAARIAAGLLFIAVGTFVFFQWSKKAEDKQLADNNQSVKVPHQSAEVTQADSLVEDLAEDPALSSGESNPKPKISTSSPSVMEQPQAAMDAISPTQPAVEAEKEADIIEQRQIAQNTTIRADSITFAYTPTVDEALAGRAAGVKVALPKDIQAEEVVVLTPEPNVLAPAKSDSFNSREEAKINGYVNISDADKRKEQSGPTVTMRRKAENNAYVITGKVTDAEDGDGLPGVNVLVKGTNYGTVTDGEGNYKITVDEQSPSLVFSFIGMENKEVKVEDANEVNVAMVNDMTQLNEIVVVGYGAERMADEIPGMIEFASPMGGRAEFKKYLEGSMRYPQQALANDIQGKVTIQFTVQTSGDIGDFRVIKGIGYGCEEEVIRLIKNGPKWNPTRKSDEPIAGKVKVKVKFRLPKK